MPRQPGAISSHQRHELRGYARGRRALSHLALARKYRPRTFGEVLAQKHVGETLRNAIKADRVSHAYLFAGPRGIGKTTMARILAMALNCPHRGEDAEPCGVCEGCRRIWSGQSSMDVVEIDAASNRGVEDARRLRERASYLPSGESRFKVYIVDEAHMLTREAWNALLKILEEPPPRVIFVFATTEVQKIQQTAAPILSRCQRFDFRRPSEAVIEQRLGEVAQGEGVSVEPEALRLLARQANGGMRDGLSLLDQVLALGGESLTADKVAEVLGVVSEEWYLQALECIAERKAAGVLPFVDRLVRNGYDIVEFHHGLFGRVRTVLQLVLDQASGDAPETWKAEYLALAQRFSSGDLLRMLRMASDLEVEGSLRRTEHPRALVELLLLRMCYLDRTVELEEVLGALKGGASLGREPLGRPESGERPTLDSAAKSFADSRSPAPSPARPVGLTKSRASPRKRPPRKAPVSSARPSGKGFADRVMAEAARTEGSRRKGHKRKARTSLGDREARALEALPFMLEGKKILDLELIETD